MRTSTDVGIVGYGVYIPIYRIKNTEIARVWGRTRVPIEEKAIAGLDEDTVTMSVEATKYALKRAMIDPKKIGAIYIGTESPSYAVKPSATIIAEAVGLSCKILAADMEFACRAGTTAMQNIIGLIASEMIEYGLAIGADVAQGKPGDELEFTAASGAAAFILGKAEESLAIFEGSSSYATDTPDFWRREGEYYPRHSYRFTGVPAYFKHIIEAGRALMSELGLRPSDFNYVVFHQPNFKFPLRVCKMLGFNVEQVKPGLIVNFIGNTYAGSSLIGLAATLDIARPGERILVISFGSGAGSDAFSIITTDLVEEKRPKAPLVKELMSRKRYIDYALYAKFRGKIRMR